MKNKDFVLDNLKDILTSLKKEEITKDRINLYIDELEEIFIFIEDNL